MPRRIEDGVCEVDYVDTVKSKAALRSLPSPNAVRDAAEVLRVLGHPSRLTVIKALEGRELCVCDLSQVLKASISATSQHLRALRTLGVITFRAQGKLAYYRLVDSFWVGLVTSVFGRMHEAEAVAPRRRRRASAP